MPQLSQRKCRKVTVLTIVKIMLLMSLSVSMPSFATTDDSPIATKITSWSQLPRSIQQYYRTGAIRNSLALSAEDMIATQSWDDDNGKNYLLQFQRFNNSYAADEPAGELIAHLYTTKGQKTQRLWQLYDYTPCDGLDVIAEFANNKAIVTDINKNGISEVSMPYYLGCRGGVSYDEMKIIMYEGPQKFAMRGNSALCNAATNLPVKPTGYGGEYKIDDKLMKQAQLTSTEITKFKQHLQQVWQDHQCSIYFNYDN